MFRSSLHFKWPLRGPVVLRNTSLLQQYRAQSTLAVPAQSTHVDHEPYWNHIAPWKDVSTEDFMSYRWQLRNTVQGKPRLERFLHEALPDILGHSKNPLLQRLKTKEDFIEDAVAALKLAPMAIRLTPHILSRVDWENPLDDPIRKQFLPLKSGIIPDHKELTLDSLHEEADSPVPGLVHRYPGRALFLATSICPVYCRFCTRSYAVGANTDTVSKSPQKPSRRRWEVVFQHIENDESLQDIVISGGDAYYLAPEDMKEIGERLLRIPHIRRMRFASKGLAVAPGRILDDQDPWATTLINLSNQGRRMGKQVCLHTHFNHINEVTWVTEKAANHLFEHGVIVRNQSVLLRGVNDTFEDLLNLIKGLSDINIQPYYIYQCDMVRGIEDLRTPLATLLRLDKEIRGNFSGFMMPSFVVDLPGGGGKRLVSTAESYNEITGEAKFTTPRLPGKQSREYTYYDPAPLPTDAKAVKELHDQQDLATEQAVINQKSILPENMDRSGTRPIEIHATMKENTNNHQEDVGKPRSDAAVGKQEKVYDHKSPRLGTSATSPYRLHPNQIPPYNNDHPSDNRMSARGFHNQSAGRNNSIPEEKYEGGSQ